MVQLRTAKPFCMPMRGPLIPPSVTGSRHGSGAGARPLLCLVELDPERGDPVHILYHREAVRLLQR